MVGIFDFDVTIFTVFSLKVLIKFAIKQKAEFVLAIEHRIFDPSKTICFLLIYF